MSEGSLKHDFYIPIATEAMTGNALAVLHELEGLLKHLLESDEAGSIDLGRLPLNEQDYALLYTTLGMGEVEATVSSMGVTLVQEAEIPGIWWVSHQNEAGDTMAEFIEITYCPEILITPVEDVREGLDVLKGRLVEASLKGE